MATNAPQAADPSTDKPPRPRRWIPVSLRLLVVMLVTLGLIESLFIGIPAYRQRQAVMAIEESGGSVEIQPAGPVWLQDLFGEDWHRLFGQPYAISLFSDERVDNDVFGCLYDLAGVKRLTMEGLVTDRGLAHLACLTQLRALFIFNFTPDVTDACLPQILRLSNLRILNLSGTGISSSGLGGLVALPELEYLELNRNQMNGANLVALKAAIPNLTIVVDDNVIVSPDELTQNDGK
jgi:hypothetical protein